VKGDAKLLEVLNKLLAEELTAINQFMLHSEMCDNWGYERLHKAIEKQAVDEMRHAESLIARILFLEGMPTVSQLNPMRIGKTVREVIHNDLDVEYEAVKSCNDAIKAALVAADDGTRDLLTRTLTDEERHVDWGEAQRDQMGLENFLAIQAKGGE